MLTKVPVLALISAGVVASTCGPKQVSVAVEPPSAVIYRVSGTGDTTRVGVGAATIVLPDNGSERVAAVAPGYRTVVRELTLADVAAAKPVVIQLKDRIVQVRVTPADAIVTLDGQPISATKTWNVEVKQGALRVLEVKKQGFKSVSHTYANREGQAPPPEVDDVSLTQRVVLVRAMPGGTQIDINGAKFGVDFAEVAIPVGGCTTVKASRPMYLPKEAQFCMTPGLQEPQPTYEFALEDRTFTLRPEPADAEIKIDGQVMGNGAQQVVVRKDAPCVKVEAKAKDYLKWSKEYCLRDNGPSLPGENDQAKLIPDRSISKSVASDQANVNFALTVNEKRNESDAWKLISQMVTNYFDVLELSDKETGYIRTGWNVESVETCCTIRTRIIIKQASTSPLRYTVKLVSERLVGAGTVKNDELFEPWDRVLLRYKDVINEMQERLK